MTTPAIATRDFSQVLLWRAAAREIAETLNWDRLVGELAAVFADAAASARQPFITTIQSSKNRIFLPNHTGWLCRSAWLTSAQFL